MIDIPESNVIKSLITKDGKLRVELVPMVTGDNPWRTRGDYIREQHRDTIRFWVTIASLLVSLLGVTVTAVIAIHTIKQVSNYETRPVAPMVHSASHDSNE